LFWQLSISAPVYTGGLGSEFTGKLEEVFSKLEPVPDRIEDKYEESGRQAPANANQPLCNTISVCSPFSGNGYGAHAFAMQSLTSQKKGSMPDSDTTLLATSF
jgi:hypothetical protein